MMQISFDIKTNTSVYDLLNKSEMNALLKTLKIAVN